MKKKAIEKIPYLKLPKTSRKKGVKYIGVTAVRTVGQEGHFFLEVYRNHKTGMDVPAARIVVTKKDFGTYFPEDGVWSRGKIEPDFWYDQLVWEPENAYREKECRKAWDENILHSDKDLQRIKSFFKKESSWESTSWWDPIRQAQENITQEERIKNRTRQYQKRQQALDGRIANTPELQEKEILTWADRTLFNTRHYIYYKKKGRRATVCCSACGGVKEGVWKLGESFESQFEPFLEEPRDKHYGTCPLCGEHGQYKAQGKVKGIHSMKTYAFTADPYKGTGAVVRYILLEKTWVLEELADEGGLVMNGAHEKLEACEIARTYFEEDKKPQTDYHKYNPYSGKDFWDDCNLYGMSNIQVEKARLLPGFEQKLKGTCLQYSAIGLYAAEAGEVNARDYMMRYQQMPQIEMLVKLKLYGIAGELVKCQHGIAEDTGASRPDRFLGIRPERVKLLADRKGDTGLLEVLKAEKGLGQKWTEEQILALEETGASGSQIKLFLNIMTLQKTLNNIKKYAGCEFRTGCAHANARLRNITITYHDYLSMRIQLGYDMTNTIYQKPRDLRAAHDKMILEADKNGMDARIREVETAYPLIRENYRKLRKKYLYEDGEYIIRPARSAGEIVREGRFLHHCVGGNDYLRKHNQQKSIILMLRLKKEPEIPYITVEINNNRIVQWYGQGDKKPDEKNMEKWLDAYTTRLKCGNPLQEYGEPELMEAI